MKNKKRVGGKYDDKWTGPYVVTEKLRHGVFRLKNLKSQRLLRRKVNTVQLKR